MASPFKIGSTQGMLRQFIMEPFVPHRKVDKRLSFFLEFSVKRHVGSLFEFFKISSYDPIP